MNDPIGVPKISPQMVKFLVPTAGLMGIYGGAFIGMLIISGRTEQFSSFSMLLLEFVLGLIGGTAVMIGVDRWIGAAANHVDWFKIPRYWIAAAISLYFADWLIEKATPWALPPFISNLVLWSAGVLAVWVDEPPETTARPGGSPGR